MGVEEMNCFVLFKLSIFLKILKFPQILFTLFLKYILQMTEKQTI